MAEALLDYQRTAAKSALHASSFYGPRMLADDGRVVSNFIVQPFVVIRSLSMATAARAVLLLCR